MFPVSGQSRLSPAAPQITKVTPYPAPTLGVNAADNLAAMNPQEAIYLYNMVPAKYGLKVRTGYREFATDIGSGGVRTIIPYKGATDADDKLFAAASDGIYDISGGGDTFVADIAFLTETTSSGYGQTLGFTTLGGQFQVYCDEENGYFLYDGTTWDAVTTLQVTGVDPGDLVACCSFKGRLWFVERDTGNAWYLPPGQVIGAATKFNFGNRFVTGGHLVNLYNWTIDGGEGIDDYLVVISSAGDVLVFKGENPAVATDWAQHGAWYIGNPPAGRRVAGAFGGELYLLSSYGVLPISKLMEGTLIEQETSYLSRKITPLIKERMAATSNDLGWEIVLIPSENLLFVGVPQDPSVRTLQYALSLNTLGWGFYRDFPYFTGAEWNRDFYFSNNEGIVYIHTGVLDDVKLADTTNFQSIEFSLLTSFQNLGPAEHFKRMQFLRPTFVTEGAPRYEVTARFDYNLNEAGGALSPSQAIGDTWDAGLWDLAIWTGGSIIVDGVRGGANMGRTIAVALRGRTTVATTLISFSMMYDSGNLL